METSKEEWVNSQNYQDEGRILCNHSMASMVFGVNTLFLAGLPICLPLIHINYCRDWTLLEQSRFIFKYSLFVELTIYSNFLNF